MKNLKPIVVLIAVSFFSYAQAQVRIGGSVDISINLPTPKVIIVKEEPRPVYTPKPHKKPKAHKPKKHHCEEVVYALGSIRNQNGRYNSFDWLIVDASLENLGNGLERLTYFTNTRETIEIIIHTNNPNDYNYHFTRNPHCTANTIISVAMNGYAIALHQGSLSLQPGHQLHAVLNLDSCNEGTFNGTVTL